MRLRLHVGAHRTGTTTLQGIIRENNVVLHSRGIKALTCWGAGERTNPGLRHFTRVVGKASRRQGVMRFLKVRAARRELRQLAGTGPLDLLVLSDENLLGKPFSFQDRTAIYPHSQRILTALASALPADPERIHIAVRDYASFLTSAYAMTAVYSSNVPRFEEIKSALTTLNRGWPDVLKDIRTAFPKSEITYSCYEESAITTTLTCLFGNDVIHFDADGLQKTTNVSPTVEAIDASIMLGERTQEDADALVQKYASGRKFDPFSQDEKEQLKARYDRDLVTLSKSGHFKLAMG